ncbi:hypothetical protein [Fontibacillus panacisegetis]|uniref:hypothetical protein n=1 Tax=Fontibacillus panacisegetis TaxID=670482 RepID=UPI000B87FB89|nr:hypothetical protein [Fontibacillus panacisegetis]
MGNLTKTYLLNLMLFATVLNGMVYLKGIIPGLDLVGVQSYPGVLLILLIIALITAWSAKKHGFPRKRIY